MEVRVRVRVPRGGIRLWRNCKSTWIPPQRLVKARTPPMPAVATVTSMALEVSDQEEAQEGQNLGMRWAAVVVGAAVAATIFVRWVNLLWP